MNAPGKHPQASRNAMKRKCQTDRLTVEFGGRDCEEWRKLFAIALEPERIVWRLDLAIAVVMNGEGCLQSHWSWRKSFNGWIWRV